ncbi:MAG: hypothetical protein AB7E47_02395 [Desulfovibrionaceae bacterium]
MSGTIRPIVNAFTSGELSPRMYGRTDHEKYYGGARKMKNMISLPQGGATSRGGSRMVGRLRYASMKARLVPFDFNDDAGQAYALEFGHQYIRFYHAGGLILDPAQLMVNGGFDSDISGWTDASEDGGGIAHDAEEGCLALTGNGVAGGFASQSMAVVAGEPYRLTFEIKDGGGLTDDDDVLVSVGETEGGGEIVAEAPFARGQHSMEITPASSTVHIRFGNRNADTRRVDTVSLVLGYYQISSPWTEDQLAGLDWVQTADTIYLAHGQVQPHTLVRNGHADWTLAAMTFTGAPEDWTAGNWPRLVTIFEDRLTLAAASSKPYTVWMSRTSAYNDFRTNTAEEGADPLATDSIIITITGKKMNGVMWLMDKDALFAGTASAEVKIWSGSSGEPLTPDAFQSTRVSTYGSAAVRPLLVANAIVFVSQSRKKVRHVLFDYTSDEYKAPEFSILSEHLIQAGVVAMDYAADPDGILWCVLADGSLVGCTYLVDEKVIAWHPHELGGGGKVESLCVTPGEKGGDVWLVVRRTLNGQQVRTVELLEASYNGYGQVDARAAYCVDCGLSTGGTLITGVERADPVLVTAPGHGLAQGRAISIADAAGMTEINGDWKVGVADYESFTLRDAAGADVDGAAWAHWDGGGVVYGKITEVAGLNHLNGHDVQCLADGAVVSVAVRNGRATLPRAAARVHVGLGFSALLQPMPMEVGNQYATFQGRRKRIMGVTVRFLHTVGGRICAGDDVADKYETVKVSRSGPNKAPSLRTGDERIALAGGSDTTGLYTIRQDEPLPMTVTAFMPEVDNG